MNPSIDLIKASDGTGPAALMTVQSLRNPGSSTIVVDSVANVNGTFIATMGTPSTSGGMISDATARDFYGHVDGANLEIDDMAPGFTDDIGSQSGDIVVIKPTTAWADEVAEVLEVAHNDDGTLKDSAVDSSVLDATVKSGWLPINATLSTARGTTISHLFLAVGKPKGDFWVE